MQVAALNERMLERVDRIKLKLLPRFGMPIWRQIPRSVRRSSVLSWTTEGVRLLCEEVRSCDP